MEIITLVFFIFALFIKLAWELGLIGLVMFGILVLIFLIALIIGQYNTIKYLHNKVRQSRSGIDVVLMKRFELIPNLVECVKGYCAHEEKILIELSKARTNYISSKSLHDGVIANDKTKDILMLSEKYPSLKASSQFIELQAALERTENTLSAARRLYNSDVNMYNSKIQTFPGNIIAKLMGEKQEMFFETEILDKNNTNVKI